MGPLRSIFIDAGCMVLRLSAPAPLQDGWTIYNSRQWSWWANWAAGDITKVHGDLVGRARGTESSLSDLVAVEFEGFDKTAKRLPE